MPALEPLTAVTDDVVIDVGFTIAAPPAGPAHEYTVAPPVTVAASVIGFSEHTGLGLADIAVIVGNVLTTTVGVTDLTKQPVEPIVAVSV